MEKKYIVGKFYKGINFRYFLSLTDVKEMGKKSKNNEILLCLESCIIQNDIVPQTKFLNMGENKIIYINKNYNANEIIELDQ